MKEREISLILQKFSEFFREIELSFEQRSEILNKGVNYDSLVIVPKISPERLMFAIETETMVKIETFLEPNEFGLLDLNRRQKEGVYVLYLKEGQGNKEESLTLFEGLVGFLIGSLTNAYCPGCFFLDGSMKSYPHFFYDKENSKLIIGKNFDDKEIFLERYIIEK